MQVLECIAPGPDDIVLPKTSSNVFTSTNVDYILRSLGVKQLILAGCLTDQCVESAVRDACDLHYLVTLVTGTLLLIMPPLRLTRTPHFRGVQCCTHEWGFYIPRPEGDLGARW